MLLRWGCTRWDGIGVLVDGQAGPFMAGARVHGGGGMTWMLGWGGGGLVSLDLIIGGSWCGDAEVIYELTLHDTEKCNT